MSSTEFANEWSATDGLNEPQADAVAHVDGPLLVFAGAGSGKTRVITYRIANLVARHSVPPYRILAVTFTNKAAGEMRERLRHLLGAALGSELWVGTFHATCARLLRRHHEAVGLGRDFLIYDDADQRSVVGRIVKDKKLDDRRWAPRMLLSKIHAWKQEAKRPADIAATGFVDDVVIQVFEAYESALRASNACDFDDLLLHVLRLVERDEPLDDLSTASPEQQSQQTAALAGRAIRRQFRHVLVDEFQDTNQVQYRLVAAIVRGHRNLAVVGDDDQSIYSWRGADVRNIRNFSREFEGAHVVRLEQNYRSTARIVRAALSVIGKSKERVPKELWTANVEGDAVEVRAAVDERDEAAQIVATIGDWQRQEWERKEIAVLYRTHAQSRVLEEELRRARLPYRIVGGLKFFDRAEVKDLLAYLRILVNPCSDVDLLRVINVPARGIGGTTIQRIQGAATGEGISVLDAVRLAASGELDAELSAAARKKLGAFVVILDALGRELAAGATPSQLAEATLEKSGYRGALEREDTEEAESRLQNLGELIGSIKDYEDQAHAAGEPATLSGFLERTALVNVGDDGKPGDDVITLMTVHAAKGLEFRGVFISGLEEDLFPFRGSRADDDEPPSLNGRSREDDSVEEERRLAYVAITRARQRLVLLHAAQRTVFGQTRFGRPSRFIRDLPQKEIVQRAPSREAFTPRSWASAPPQPTRPRVAQGHPVSAQPVSTPAARQAGERFVELEEGATGLIGGIRVKHQRFGEGRVVELLEGPEPKVVATFPGWGTMTILQRFVQFVRA